jgi:hypothetical protein
MTDEDSESDEEVEAGSRVYRAGVANEVFGATAASPSIYDY